MIRHTQYNQPEGFWYWNLKDKILYFRYSTSAIQKKLLEFSQILSIKTQSDVFNDAICHYKAILMVFNAFLCIP